MEESPAACQRSSAFGELLVFTGVFGLPQISGAFFMGGRHRS